jgi:hypothetical protein
LLTDSWWVENGTPKSTVTVPYYEFPLRAGMRHDVISWKLLTVIRNTFGMCLEYVRNTFEIHPKYDRARARKKMVKIPLPWALPMQFFSQLKSQQTAMLLPLTLLQPLRSFIIQRFCHLATSWIVRLTRATRPLSRSFYVLYCHNVCYPVAIKTTNTNRGSARSPVLYLKMYWTTADALITVWQPFSSISIYCINLNSSCRCRHTIIDWGPIVLHFIVF